MKTIFRLLVVLLLVGGWGLAALSVHVVRTPGQIPITIVTKQRLGVIDTYVDTTKWTLDDVSKHPAVVKQLIGADRLEVIKHIADKHGGDLMSQVTDALNRAPSDEDEGGSTQPTDGHERTASRQGKWVWQR